jgi:hypothetical protein
MAVRIEDRVRRYIGTSADTKPTGVPAGSIFYERDTAKIYIMYDGTNWVQYIHDDWRRLLWP